MQKAIKIAHAISKDPGKNWTEELELINLFSIFKPIYKLDLSIVDSNSVVSYAIFAFDPDSQILNIQKDRAENKSQVASAVSLNTSNKIIAEIISNGHQVFNDVMLTYLLELTDWRWPEIYSLLEYSAKMLRYVNQNTEEEKTFDKMNKDGTVKAMTEDYDIGKISKVNIDKYELLKRSISAREDAEKLIAAISKDFVQTETAVQADYGFSYVETSKKKTDVESWKEFIKQRNNNKS